jgi:hypothetical protein
MAPPGCPRAAIVDRRQGLVAGTSPGNPKTLFAPSYRPTAQCEQSVLFNSNQIIWLSDPGRRAFIVRQFQYIDAPWSG